MRKMIQGVDVILRLDVIGNLGEVHVSNDDASFGLGAVAIKNGLCNESITDRILRQFLTESAVPEFV